MLTRCPQCESIFKVDQKSLSIADGIVECGECETHFDAIAQQLDPSDLYSDPKSHAESRDESRYQIIEPVSSKAQKPKTSLLWTFGVLLLAATAVGQYLLLQRVQLSQNIELRPILKQLCAIRGCEIPLISDISRFQIVEHKIGTHPKDNRGLIITGTLVNNATFAQRYPLVELQMTDINQKVVASRQFRAAEYLPPGVPNRVIEANTEAPVLIEIVDPGEQAIGFEFKFVAAR